MKRAAGGKVKDNIGLLRKSMKKEKRRKEKSSKQWYVSESSS
jgi:hypothetical protein